jgi:hypothetical protein
MFPGSGLLDGAERLLAVTVIEEFTPWIAARSVNPGFLTGEYEMGGMKIAAIVLIVAGVLGLVYGSFSYTKETHELKVGPLDLSIKDKQTVAIPIGAGVGAIAGGVILLLVERKKS